MIPLAQASVPGKPVTLTEAGYFTAYQDASGWGGVDELTQAKNTLNLLADAFKDGVQQTYLYDLMEGIAGPSTTDIGNTFGLFRSDGTPKPTAVALHNLTSVLADPAGGSQNPAPGALAYSISPLPAGGDSLLLQKANGAFDLMVWAEPQDWNPTTEQAMAVAAVDTTVTLGATYQTVKLFDPLQGATPIATLTDVAAVTLALTDHPLIVEVEPNPSAATYQPGVAGGTITSTGADTVLVGTGAVTVLAVGPTITVQGGPGALTYSGTAQATITGGGGAMNLTVSGSNSTITGGSGRLTALDLVGGNTITGRAGSAITVTTTTGHDIIQTGAWSATNRLTLGAGDDTVIANGASTITGTTGTDTIAVNGWWGNVTTGTGTSSVAFAVAGVVTTHGQDTVTANTNLTVDAEGRATNLTGGNGFIWFSGAGTAAIQAGSGGGNFDLRFARNDTLTTHTGATDTVWLGTGPATVATLGTDTVFAGGGATTISALAGTDNVYGGAGAMTFLLGAATSSVTAGVGGTMFDILDTAAAALSVENFVVGRDWVHMGAGIGLLSEQIVNGAAHLLFSNDSTVTLAGVGNVPSTQLLA